MAPLFLANELASAANLATRAGAMALHMRDHITVTHKPGGLGPVTNADIAIDSFLCEELNKLFPADCIISEEGSGSHAAGSNGRVWYVDPIDGTASYIIGSDDYAVMIGLAIDGIASLGVIYQPSSRQLWHAVIDPLHNDTFAEVAVGNTKKRICIPMQAQPTELTLIASRTRRSKRQTEMIARLAPAHIVYKSSIGLKAMVIAEGGANFYVAWSNRLAKWDSCAPAAILTAAGGYAAFVDGTPLDFAGSPNHNKPVLFARFQPNEQFIAELEGIMVM